MSNRIYVGNLSFSSTDDSLRAAFESVGQVSDVHIVTDRETGRSRGFGFVTMGTPEEARKAIEAFHGKALDGRTLKVNEAEAKAPKGNGGGGGGGRDRW